MTRNIYHEESPVINDISHTQNTLNSQYFAVLSKLNVCEK